MSAVATSRTARGGLQIREPRDALAGALFIAFALLVSDLGLLLATLVLTLLCGLAHRQVRFAELAGLGMVLACFGGLVFAWGLGLQLPVLPG